ncbi:hypothetical protein NKJ35_16460 [Mesorhizobium sp. M0136]|uniref:hypothetical protein n=1 Tax=Mesorhizobium sp. M0136 TaxID=2956890 RepID=UPI00333B5466
MKCGASKTICNARDNAARILASPSPNDIHRDWQGESYVDTGMGFVVRKAVLTDIGRYLYGDLYSTRGSVINPKKVYVIAKEWNCAE